MATRTVGEAFQALLERIDPVESELDSLRSHKATIKQALTAEFRDFNRVEDFGSHKRSTAIRRHSDIDYLAVLGKDDVSWGGTRVRSSTTLDRVRRALETRFPRSSIRTSGPAVIVEFTDGAVDVVPGVWTGTIGSGDGYPRFDIPDTEDGWMSTSPQRHAKYLAEKDTETRSRLHRSVRLMKGWKHSRSPNIPFLGFHVELLLADNDTCGHIRSYQNIICDAFVLLRDRGGKSLNDPLGISPRIPLANTENQRDQVVKAAEYAATHASSAIDAELGKDHDEAFRQWNLVFNGGFPARHY